MLDYRSIGETNNFQWLNIERARGVSYFPIGWALRVKLKIFQDSKESAARYKKFRNALGEFRACSGYILIGDTNSYENCCSNDRMLTVAVAGR